MPSRLTPGNVILDKYRVERVLGRGAMGMVVLARHLRMDRLVAIKTLRHDVVKHPRRVARFYREAQIACTLQSEHVGRVYDVDCFGDGTPYMVMEYLRGCDLRHLIRTGGKLAPGAACELVLQACEALAEAHSVGIVHRDLKPANVFLTRSAGGAPLLKVIDFGISKVSMFDCDTITVSIDMLGTPYYMSPEQIRSSKRVDERADIWSLGVVLYELLSARRPFVGPGMVKLFRAISSEPMQPLAGEVPDGLAAVVARCLEKKPAARFANMAELACALAPYAATPAQAARSCERAACMLGLSEPPTLPYAGTAEGPDGAVARVA
ncbi:serine/threonine-protein kinase [Haliangium sp.]|uniref:serine/threonine-protein kinase n=1 Tax=Haliangium sp. TaxID=2663208 RepID=UPI003D09BCB8